MPRAATTGIEPLECFFAPQSIAIIGASPNSGSITGQPIQHLVDRKYAGRIYPVNSKYEEVAGLRCYRSVAELPEVADLAVIVVGAARVPDALTDCARKGIKVAVIISGGFSEAGEEGAMLQAQLAQIRNQLGIRVVGPNCQGMLNVTQNVCAGFGPVLGTEYGVPPGGLSFVTHSGGFGFGIVNLAAQQGIGFRRIVSTGNEVDLSAVDFIEHFVHDAGTRVIAAYLEGLRQGHRLRELGEFALANGKPILIWKVGTTEAGKRAASSHTASLSGDEAVFRAVLKQIGAIEIRDVLEIVDYSRAFLKNKRPAGNRVAIFSASGGAGVLMSDECVRSGLEIPALPGACIQKLAAVAPALSSLRNPIDVMGRIYDEPAVLKQALSVIAADPSVDSLAIVNPLRKGARAADIARIIVEIDHETSKPVFVSWAARPDFAREAFSILDEAGVPRFDSPVRCAKSLGVLTRYSETCRKARTRNTENTAFSCRGEAVALLESYKDDVLSEYATKRLLQLYGVPLPREHLAQTASEAVSIAQTLGYPVAIKVQSPDIPHKTEAGAVRLDIRSPAMLQQAYGQIVEHAHRYAPAANIEGVLVQEMVSGGIETILGVVYDSSFGPAIMFGAGGIYAEIMRDVSFRLAPISKSEALEMIRETKCYALLAGARSQGESDIDALANIIVKIGHIAADLPNELRELDINPLTVMPKGQGVKAIDALITRQRQS